MRRVFLCLLIGIMVLAFAGLLSGCAGEKQLTEEEVLPDILVVSEDGSIELTIRDHLEQEYYDPEELFDMATQEVLDFMSSYDGASVSIQKTQYDKEEQVVAITYRMESLATFSAFTGRKIFYGTITEAVAAGYYMESVSLVSLKGGDRYTQMQVLADTPQVHVVVTDYPAIVRGPWGIRYYSDNAYLSDSRKEVDMTRLGNGYGVIIMKK